MPCVLSAQVVSVLSSPREGPRNLGTWPEMALAAEPDAYFDPSTILQTQDRLSQDYEGLQALAEVTFLLKKCC